MASNTEERWTAHWRCFLACGLVVLSPFQYGIDFGMIGGLQAMVGFLKVSIRPTKPTIGSNEKKINPVLIICVFGRSTDTLRLLRPSGGISTPPGNS